MISDYMKNMLIEMYNLKNPKLQFFGDKIHIVDNEQRYELECINNNEQINIINDICSTNYPKNLNQIIKSVKNEIIIEYNAKKYILTKKEKNTKKLLEIIKENLSDVKKFNIDKIKYSDWFFLWIEKNDKTMNIYKLNNIRDNTIDESIMYFFGMAETAITYYKNIEKTTNKDLIVSHRRVKEIKNPLNIVIDQKERDIAEYIKFIFIERKIYYNQFDEINEIILKNNLSYEKIYSRVLYPTFYFDELELYLQQNKKKDKLLEYLKRVDEYEQYLKLIHKIFSEKVSIKKIDWIN